MAATELTDAQWAFLETFFRQPEPSKLGGRPRRDDVRAILDGVLWVLRTGAQWNTLPDKYPPTSTCHRYHQRWSRDGTYAAAFAAIVQHLSEREQLDHDEAFVDGSFRAAKKGAERSA